MMAQRRTWLQDLLIQARGSPLAVTLIALAAVVVGAFDRASLGGVLLVGVLAATWLVQLAFLLVVGTRGRSESTCALSARGSEYETPGATSKPGATAKTRTRPPPPQEHELSPRP